MIIGVPREIKEMENRVGLTPGGAAALHTRGHEVLVETSAGAGSGFENDGYLQAGARIVDVAADVWDVEPLPLDDPLLGRHNVVHTPHNAGRTIDANELWTEKLVVQFKPR